MDKIFDLPPIEDPEKIKEKIKPLKKLLDDALNNDRSTNFKKTHNFGKELDKK